MINSSRPYSNAATCLALVGFSLLTGCLARIEDPNSGDGSGRNKLASITMPIPEKLKPMVNPSKINAYNLVITPGSCDAGVTGTTIEKIAQGIDMNGAILANEKIKQGCAYTLALSLGQASADKSKLEKIYLTNDVQDKRTQIGLDQSRASMIKIAALVFVTESGKADLGLIDQAIVVPSVNESDLDIKINIGQGGSGVDQNPSGAVNPGASGSNQIDGDYNWKAFARLTEVPTYSFSGNDYGSAFYKDIMIHTSPKDRYLTGVSSTQAHESLHGVHNSMRNITADKDAFFYYRDGKGIYVVEPVENARDIKNHVGASFQQLAAMRYKTYLIDQVASWANTLYLFDEWSAYVGTTRSAVESLRAGKWDANGNADPIDGIADFMYFGSAALLSIKNADANYLAQNTQFKAAFAMIMEESASWVNEASKESIWKGSKAWAKIQNLQTSPDAAEVRTAIKELMGPVWTKRVLGF